MRLEHHDIPQDIDGEWGALRAGHLTGSDIAAIMANYGNAFGSPAKALAARTACEQLTGDPVSSDFQSAAMQRGHEDEPVCNQLYQEQTFTKVGRGGFFSRVDAPIMLGCSPDGLVGDDGITEYKSQCANVHFETVQRGTIPSKYRWQVAFNTWVAGRDWCDFASYCKDFPQGKRLFVCRYALDPSGEEVAMMEARIADFFELAEECKQVILNNDYMVAA